MSIDQFIALMKSFGLTDMEIVYLLDLDSIRQANSMYSDLDTLASLITRLARPLLPDADSAGRKEGC